VVRSLITARHTGAYEWEKIGGCDGFCSTVGLESFLGWCHAEKQNAPHHHLWTFLHWLIGLCQLVPTTSLQVHLLSDEETIEKPSAGMLVCLAGVASES
jgi:hypothetical protein